MKKITVMSLVFVMIISLCACSENPITWNEDGSEIYYNGYTYYETDHYYVDTENAECSRITLVMSVFGGYSYYGNDLEKPDYIYSKKTSVFYLRSDVHIDRDTKLILVAGGGSNRELNLQENETFSFTFSEVTTGETVDYIFDTSEDFALRYKFKVNVPPYSAVYQYMRITENNGVFYLQEGYDADYNVITQEFYDEISRIVPPFEPI